jgi:hypothetical protein
MALFLEPMLECARKLLDTADIVRDAMLRKPPHPTNRLLFIEPDREPMLLTQQIQLVTFFALFV